MTTGTKKGRGFTARQLTPAVGVNGAVVEDADRREIASCSSLAMAELIADALNGQAEPSAQEAVRADEPEQRSFDSIEISGRVYFEKGFDRGDPPSVAIPRAFMAGAALAVGPLARALIDAAWDLAYWEELGEHASCPPATNDAILASVIGEFGPILAWPNVPGKCPSFGEVAEVAVALIAEAARTERAWRESGAAVEQAEQWAFIEGQLTVQREAGAMLRQLAMVVLGQQGEAIEQTRIIRRGLEEIRSKALPGAGQRAVDAIREAAGELLAKMGEEL